jgi:hypothetical protein
MIIMFHTSVSLFFTDLYGNRSPQFNTRIRSTIINFTRWTKILLSEVLKEALWPNVNTEDQV